MRLKMNPGEMARSYTRPKPPPSVFELALAGNWLAILARLQATSYRKVFSAAQEENPTPKDDLLLVAQVNVDSEGKTMLMYAATAGHANTMRKLVEYGADVHRVDKDGQSALMFAAKGKHIQVLDYLLSLGANINNADKIGMTALMIASLNGSLAVVDYLATKGADLNLVNEDGNTALMIAAEKAADCAVIKALLDWGADRAIVNEDGETALQLSTSAEVTAILQAAITPVSAENWLSQRLRASALPDQAVYHCVRVLVQQEGFATAAILQSLPEGLFTCEYLSRLGITALGTQQILRNVYAALKATATELPPAAVHTIPTPGIAPTADITCWLGEKLASFGIPAERIAHCECILVKQEGFASAAILQTLPADLFTYAYLRKIGFTTLGTQQVLMNVYNVLKVGVEVTTTVTPTAPHTTIATTTLTTTSTAVTANCWLGAKLSEIGIPAESIARCERILVKQQGFATAEVLGALPADKFSCAYLNSVGIAGLGLQHALICIKSGWSNNHGQSYVLARSVYAAAAVKEKRAGVKRARHDDSGDEESEEEEEEDEEDYDDE